jgi:AcrR family transcriptional regulator
MASDTKARIVTAAEDVVLTEGVARLTLEKAAARAGVSKGGVLYHFPTRSALVAAMVARLTDGFDAALRRHHEAELAAWAEQPDGLIDRQRPTGSYARAYVAESFALPEGADEERGERLGAAVLAAMASEPELLAPLQAAFARWQADLEADTGDPTRATIARLASDGLWLSELFGMAPLTPDLRLRVRDELIRMVG